MRNKLRSYLGSGSSSSLALDLSQDGVVLFAREAQGEWARVSEARLGADDFASRLDEMRVEALVRAGGPQPITLWLPEEQILTRQYLLNGSGEDACAEARRRISAETVYEGSELMIALSPARRGEPTTVLAALVQTVNEASSHARSWGFVPGSVSTRVAAPIFGGQAPVFRAAERMGVKAARLSARAVAASLAVVVGGAALYGAISTVEPLFDSVEPTDPSAPVFAVVRHVDEPPAGGPRSSAQIQIGYPQGLALPKIAVSDVSGSKLAGALHHKAVPAAFVPVTLKQPGSGRAMRVGPAPHRPDRARPGRLPSIEANLGSASVEQVRGAVDRIRTEAAERIAVAREASAPQVSKSADQSEGTIVLAALPSEKTGPAARRSSRLIDAPDVKPEPQSVVAPAEMEQPPEPRPAGVEPEPEPQPEVATSEAEATTPGVPAVSSPSEEETAAPEPPSLYAALDAPKPRTRPQNVPVFKQAPVQPKAFKTTPGPRSVRTAAAEYGLALDQTSLIGIIDARAGRQALVRLPSGSFRKVIRGDVLEGWRVSSISREAMRLTKQGQNRTLLLVSH